ncbi:TATA-binding protein-associated factor 172 isoform X2 [Diaphorina citri]|uniref:TATA-binding protein-associated factor 172 isoform X1 n=1 Tax=Diaphorina citri TaxID=121845 RepID=A0A3Q0JCI9_DIACI|nr:TATA-binding protein-associated factor 172 isoform X1 [Diaphorina citri]XP_026686156.1 TATA-binding protein-associated factor 172 isoform X2 [Diaphorina citri]
MTSRLDRLFVLLETGSTPYTRHAAATQLGELQRLHPHELHTLLRRTYCLLRSNSWDTRLAAAQAVGAVVRHTPPWSPMPVCVQEPDGNIMVIQDGVVSGKLSLAMFDIERILDSSSCLTASQGSEFDMEEDSMGSTSTGIGPNNKDSLQRAHQQLHAKLGFPLLDPSITDTLLTKEDLITTSRTKDIEQDKPNVGDILSSGSLNNSGGGGAMSSREMNRARRKARRAVAKHRPRAGSGQDPGEHVRQDDIKHRPRASSGPDPRTVSGQDTGECLEKRIKLEDEGGGGEEGGVPDVDGTWGDATEWPLEGFCDGLCGDLFSPLWEVRHGVATALREIIKVHGRGAGKVVGQTKVQMEHSNRAWLEDVSVRLLCVLALDRFGDFVSDQVVAPVRETCAQALGVVISLIDEESLVTRVVDLLLTLAQQKHWETRHGGLLGLKYILAVKQDMVPSLLPRSLPLILSGLADPVDDVGNIAAATLIPVAPHLIATPHVPALITQLWTLLADHDQLTSACNNFMSLLAAIMCHPMSHASTALSEPVMEVLPRLYPYLSHSTSSVRLATLQTMATMTRAHRTLDTSVESLVATLRHVFQRSLIEHVTEIQDMVEQVWESILTRVPLNTLLMAVCPHIASWLCLAMQPANVPFDNTQLVAMDVDESGAANSAGLKYYVGGVETVPLATREVNATRCRLLASCLLGLASTYVIQPMTGLYLGTEQPPCPIQCYVNLLLVYVNSKSALQRLVSGLVIADWNRRQVLQPPQDTLNSALVQCLDENIYYDELGAVYTKLLHDTTDLLSYMKHYELGFDYDAFNRVLTLDEIEHLVGTLLVQSMNEQRTSKTVKCLERIDERRKSILSFVQTTRKDQFNWHIMVQAVLAGALLRLQCLPPKVNPIIKPLMESIKFETNPLLQDMAATHLAILLGLCSQRNPCPNNKIVHNLCTFLCCDPEFTPVIEALNSTSSGPGLSSLIRSNSEVSNSSGSTSEPTTPSTPGSNPGGGSGFWTNNIQHVEHAYPVPIRTNQNEGSSNNTNNNRDGFSSGEDNKYRGILTLLKQQQNLESKPRPGSKACAARGPGRPALVTSACDSLLPTSEPENEVQKQTKNQCRGASLALKAIVKHFGESLPDNLPKLWDMMTSQLINTVNPDSFDSSVLVGDDEAARSLVSCLQVFEVIAPSLHPTLLNSLLSLQSRLCLLLTHPYRAVRHMGARCLSILATLQPNAVMSTVLSQVLPLLNASQPDIVRQGAVEALCNILDKMELKAVPYLILLVVPLLGRVSDQDTWVRLGATSCFATCIHLMPLDSALGTSTPSNSTQVCSSLHLPADLASRKASESRFLEQLFDPSRIPDFTLPSALGLTVTLRSYQQAGVNWLWFLRRYNLHGILCDDMGLGKTLQSICVLAGDQWCRHEEEGEETRLPSLVVCPPTLTGHWMYEVLKFLPNKFLNPLQYAGPPHEREKLRSRMKEHNLIIASYDIIRKDNHVFSEVQWNYCILDEGEYLL